MTSLFLSLRGFVVAACLLDGSETVVGDREERVDHVLDLAHVGLDDLAGKGGEVARVVLEVERAAGVADQAAEIILLFCARRRVELLRHAGVEGVVRDVVLEEVDGAVLLVAGAVDVELAFARLVGVGDGGWTGCSRSLQHDHTPTWAPRQL